MIGLVTKGTRFNLRVTEDFRADLQTLADYYGITMSAMAHSLLVRAVRKEKEDKPEIFGEIKFNAIKKTLKGEVNKSDVAPRRKNTGTG